jgi:thiamine biosynthesis lipoprotein
MIATSTVAADQSTTFAAMATDVTVRTRGQSHTVLAELARAVFVAVEAQCSRFDSRSPLMRANAAATEWCTVPAWCFAALKEAEAAYRITGGAFDPRVMNHLMALGYDHTLPFGSRRITCLPAGPDAPPLTRRWRPSFDEKRQAVRIGSLPVDLGGIGKGLALRWAAELIGRAPEGAMIEAGGDCWLGGDGPQPPGWQVGIEDPGGGVEPIAVLSLRDLACATSSVRVRSWRVGGRSVHHLIDPRTGRPGGRGLLAVTVVHPDPALAEVLSKAVFRPAVPELWRRPRSSRSRR